MATIRDVAKLAGVSVATVSRYINDKGSVNEENQRKVGEVVRALNYTPNEVARSLNKKKSKFIGLLVPQIDNPYFSSIIRGAESVANNSGYHLIIGNVSNEDDEARFVESLRNNNISGVISAVGSSQIYDDKNNEIPMVRIDRIFDSSKYSVSYDEFFGGRLAGMSIINGGAKKVLVNAGPESLDIAEKRFQGIRRILDENDISYDVYRSDDFDYTSAQKFSLEVSKYVDDYDSIIAANDIHALCIALEIQKKGLSIPEDIQIIGYDNTLYSKVFNPPLATIDHDGHELGRRALELLLDIMKGEVVHSRRIQLQVELVKNGSLRNV